MHKIKVFSINIGQGSGYRERSDWRWEREDTLVRGERAQMRWTMKLSSRERCFREWWGLFGVVYQNPIHFRYLSFIFSHIIPIPIPIPTPIPSHPNEMNDEWQWFNFWILWGKRNINNSSIFYMFHPYFSPHHSSLFSIFTFFHKLRIFN